jgi:hypothetical protein
VPAEASAALRMKSCPKQWNSDAELARVADGVVMALAHEDRAGLHVQPTVEAAAQREPSPGRSRATEGAIRSDLGGKTVTRVQAVEALQVCAIRTGW